MFAVQGPGGSFPPPALRDLRGRGNLPQERLRAQSESRKESYSLDLTVRTAEGDMVRISLAALAQSESSSLAARGGGTRVNAAGSSSLSSFAATLTVEGDLNEQEVADIKKILATAQSSGTGAPQSLKSLESFALSYQYQVERTQSRVLALA